jgi:hypothetical protein
MRINNIMIFLLMKLYHTHSGPMQDVTQTGIVTTKTYQNSFSFLDWQLSHERLDLHVHSMPHDTGRIGKEGRVNRWYA